MTNAEVHSRAARTLMLDGAREGAALCTLRLENVKLLREREPNEVRVTANSRLDMSKVDCVNLKVQVTGGEISANHCSFTGTPKQDIHVWPGTKWSGDDNVFGVTGIRHENRWFYAKDAKAFTEVFGSDANSRWQ